MLQKMRLHWGAIPYSADFIPDESWKSLREPSPWIAQILALPIGFVVGVSIAILWFVITPLRDIDWSLSLPGILLLFVCIIVVHELIHAFTHPMTGLSPRSILGFWPSCLLFYAHYDAELTRNRFVAILLMPLLVISFMPLLLAAVTGMVSEWLMLASVFNAICACMDILGACMILYQLPASAITRNQGWKTYWRENKTMASSPIDGE